MSDKTLPVMVSLLGDDDALRSIGRVVLRRMVLAFVVGLVVGIALGWLLL